MNERIEKLFEQALEEFKAENKYATIIVPNTLKEKFAELIVSECMEVAHPKLTDVGEWAAGMRLVQKRLKQHFGVEK